VCGGWGGASRVRGRRKRAKKANSSRTVGTNTISRRQRFRPGISGELRRGKSLEEIALDRGYNRTIENPRIMRRPIMGKTGPQNEKGVP